MPEEFTVDEVLEQRRQLNVEQNGNRRSRKIFLGLTLLVAFSLPLIPVFTGSNQNYILHILLYIFMYIAMASSWNILGDIQAMSLWDTMCFLQLAVTPLVFSWPIWDGPLL